MANNDSFNDDASNSEQELDLREQLLSCHDKSNRKMMCELFDMKAGKFISASQISNVKTDIFQYPCYGGNGLRGYVAKNNKDGEYVLVGRQGALCGNVCYVNESFYATEHAVVVADKGFCIPRYTFHLLTFADLNQYKTSGAQPGLSVSRLEKIELYVPSLERQQAIVDILDTFTDAISNLEEELALREKQFEYYREQLFNFDDETSLARKLFSDDREYLMLGKICEVYDGTHQTPKYTTEGIPFISVENIQDIYGSQKFISINDYNAYKVKPKVGDMFMTRIGSIGSCAVVDKQVELAYYVSLALLRPNPSLVNVRYLKHFLESNIGVTEIRKHSLLHAVPLKINKNDICKIMITLCSLSTQQQIVEILDTFEAMIANIKEEIALRTKQYEYYREKLLSFGK